MSKYQIDEITNAAGTGAPNFPKGISTDGTNAFLYIPWTTYTPIIAEVDTATSVNIQYRRVGDSLEVRGEYTTGSTPTGGDWELPLPAGLTVGGINTPGTIPVGSHYRDLSQSASEEFQLLAKYGNTFLNIGRMHSTVTTNPLNIVGGSSLAGSERQAFSSRAIPIQEWA